MPKAAGHQKVVDRALPKARTGIQGLDEITGGALLANPRRG